jgi:hypothetical protein
MHLSPIQQLIYDLIDDRDLDGIGITHNWIYSYFAGEPMPPPHSGYIKIKHINDALDKLVSIGIIVCDKKIYKPVSIDQIVRNKLCKNS